MEQPTGRPPRALVAAALSAPVLAARARTDNHVEVIYLSTSALLTRAVHCAQVRSAQILQALRHLRVLGVHASHATPSKQSIWQTKLGCAELRMLAFL